MQRTILVASDGSGVAKHAADFAVETAKCEDAEIVVLGVLHPHFYGDTTEFGDAGVLLDQIRKTIAEEVERLSTAGVRVSGRVWDTPTDQVPDAIEQAARDVGAQLIVVGTHGRHGLDRALLGSVTEGLIRRSTIPVLSVPPGVVTPAPAVTGKTAAGATA